MGNPKGWAKSLAVLSPVSLHLTDQDRLLLYSWTNGKQVHTFFDDFGWHRVFETYIHWHLIVRHSSLILQLSAPSILCLG